MATSKKKGGKGAGTGPVDRKRAAANDAAGTGVTRIILPTKYRPQLCAAKPTDKNALRAEHGVSFRRRGKDCLVEATNGRMTVRIVLEDQGDTAPKSAVVPVRALRALAGAKEEEATLTFQRHRVLIEVDNEEHTFPLIAPELPFPDTDASGALDGTSGRVEAGQLVDATMLARVQRALGCDSLALRGSGAVLRLEATDGSSNFGVIEPKNDEAKLPLAPGAPVGPDGSDD